MKELFDFTDEQMEYITDLLATKKTKKIDKIALYKKIDDNLEKFIKNNDKKSFNKLKNKMSENERKIFYFMVHSSNIKIPNEYYSIQK